MNNTSNTGNATGRLDLVTNDAGELVRREHARDLGAGVVVAVYRLVKLAQLHDLQNQAFLRQLDQTHAIVQDYCLRSGMSVNILFAQKAVFVAGQLMKGSRQVYDMASELADIMEWCGGSELLIARETSRDALFAFAEAVRVQSRGEKGRSLQLPTNAIRLRQVGEAARLRGLEIERLPDDQKVVRMYASAVVVMRRFFEDLQAGRYVLPRRIKRIAQSLVDLSEGGSLAFLGVTEARNANHDEAGKAVNAAILAVAVARELQADRSTLAQIAMAAMMHDVGRPRAMAIGTAAMGMGGGDMPMPGVMTLSEDQEDRLAGGTAAVLTALGRLNEPTIGRTVIAFEALWQRRQQWIGPLYGGVRAPTLQARLIWLARRYNDLVTPEPGLPPPSPHAAIGGLYEESADPVDRLMLMLLAGTLSILPVGTIVQLSTGEVAEVIARDGEGPLDRPMVKILTNASGAAARPVTLDLAASPDRSVVRVINTEGWGKGAPVKDTGAGYGSDAPPPNSHASGVQDAQLEQLEEIPDAAESVPSMDSLGSTPSQVAGAMGRSMSIPVPSAASRATATAMPPAMRQSQGQPQPHAQDEDARTMMVQSPFEEADGPSSKHRPLVPAFGTSDQPTARGVLETTPVPHVLVYMLDHALNGTVVLYPMGQAESIITFVEGVPAKVRLGIAGFFLGEYLTESGALRADRVNDAVRQSKQAGTLMGEYLVRNQVITRETLDAALQRQVVQRVAYLANLPPATEYAFFADRDFLDDGASGDAVRVAALNPILSAVRIWKDRPRVRATLARIGTNPLILHDDANVAALNMTPDEERVLDAIVTRRPLLQELLDANVTDVETTSSVVYALAVTRQFAFPGQQKQPMAPRKGSIMPPPSAAASKRSSTTKLPAVRPVLVARRPGSSAAIAGGPVSAVPSTRAFGAVSTRSLAASAVPVAAGSAPGSSPGSSRNTVAPASSRGFAPASAPAPGTIRSGGFPHHPQQQQLQTKAPPSASRATKGSGPPAPLAPPIAPARSSIPSLPPALGGAGPVSRPPQSLAPQSLAPGSIGANDASAEQAMTFFRTAETQLQRGDLNGALAAADKAVGADPTQSEYAALRAWVAALAKGGPQVNASIDDLDALLTIDPRSERALLYRGKLYKRANRPEEALRDLELLLTINPKHREATGEVRLLKMHVKKA